MKKSIALLIALVMAMSMLFACDYNTTSYEERIAALEQEIEFLKEQNQEVPETTIPEKIIIKESIPDETAFEETAPEETVPEETVDWETVLDSLANSNSHEAWLKVAQSEYATESQLQQVVEKMVQWDDDDYMKMYYGRQTIASAIVVNPATTEEILQAMLKIRDPEIWIALAYSAKAGEETFLELAKIFQDSSYELTTIDNPYGCPGYKFEERIVSAILENPSATETVLIEWLKGSKRYPHSWLVIADSKKECVSEKVLKKIAERSLKIEYYEAWPEDPWDEYCGFRITIAAVLANNKRTTPAVMDVLLASDIPDVRDIANAWFAEKFN